MRSVTILRSQIPACVAHEGMPKTEMTSHLALAGSMAPLNLMALFTIPLTFDL